VAVITVMPSPSAFEMLAMSGRGDTAEIVMKTLYSKPGGD